jgi:hypothetical protein
LKEISKKSQLEEKFNNLVQRIDQMKMERELRNKEPHSDTLAAQLTAEILAKLSQKGELG